MAGCAVGIFRVMMGLRHSLVAWEVVNTRNDVNINVNIEVSDTLDVDYDVNIDVRGKGKNSFPLAFPWYRFAIRNSISKPRV